MVFMPVFRQKKLMREYKFIFWDFDGVIKESVNVKTMAYYSLFEKYGHDIASKVKAHHLENGGISRYEKIPIYLEWSGIIPNRDLVCQLCEEFSKLVCRQVIDSPWVPGVKKYLFNNSFKQKFILVSATPQKEIEFILSELKLTNCFLNIYGSPMNKEEAIFETIAKYNLQKNDCLMIGDATSDLEAANKNNIDFLFRKHEFNIKIFKEYNLDYISDFDSL
jgi:phosphoglycolate phosphatase-like HAD superfamily hydrolase